MKLLSGLHSAHAARLLASLLALLALSQAQAGEVVNFGDLLAAFDAAYEPPAELKDAAFQVAVLGRHAQLDSLPSLTLSERVTWADYDRLLLDVDLSVQLPLFRSKAAPLAALQTQRLLLLAAETALVKVEARNQFITDLLALALLRGMEADAAAALEQLRIAGWSPPTALSEALALPPHQRDLLAAYWRVAGLLSFASSQLPIVEHRVATALKAEHAPQRLPAFAEFLAAATPAAPDQRQCTASWPLEQQARLTHQQQLSEAQVRNTVDLRLDLNAGTAYRNGGLSATLGIEARLPLPTASPVSGQLGLAAHQGGVDQTLRLSWPAQPASSRHVADKELLATLEQELRSIQLNLDAARRATTAAASEVEATELQLLWAAIDLGGMPTDIDLADAKELASAASAEPFAELHLLPLRADLAFARLTLTERLLELQLLCGEE